MPDAQTTLILMTAALTAAAFVRYVLVPVGWIVYGIYRWSKAHPTLMEMAEHFPPNGTSLHEQLAMIQVQLAALQRTVENHLLDRKPNGRRRYDPQDG